jgi:hypothetical protein
MHNGSSNILVDILVKRVHNYSMMKLKIQTPRKTRAHKVLWDRDLPFRPKREENKLAYRRKAKHSKKESVE